MQALNVYANFKQAQVLWWCWSGNMSEMFPTISTRISPITKQDSNQEARIQQHHNQFFGVPQNKKYSLDMLNPQLQNLSKNWGTEFGDDLLQGSCGWVWTSFTSSPPRAATAFTSPSRTGTTRPMWPSMISLRLSWFWWWWQWLRWCLVLPWTIVCTLSRRRYNNDVAGWTRVWLHADGGRLQPHPFHPRRRNDRLQRWDERDEV